MERTRGAISLFAAHPGKTGRGTCVAPRPGRHAIYGALTSTLADTSKSCHTEYAVPERSSL